MSFDFTIVNKAILDEEWAALHPFADDARLHTYLLNNRVAFLYAQNSHSQWAANICRIEESLRAKYVNSLRLIKSVCTERSIDYLLYKTHFYIPQIPDGDIDLLVRAQDFDAFMSAFEERGFRVEVDEEGKGKCEHSDFSVIEPHINVSWRGAGRAAEDFLWRDVRQVEIDGESYNTASLEVELLSLAAKVVFEPAYLDLHSIKTITHLYETGVDEQAVLGNAVNMKAISEVLEFATAVIRKPDQKLPAFLPSSQYLRLWTLSSLKNSKPHIYFLHIIYFLYWKYRYAFRDKLPFTHHHEWLPKT